MGRRRQKPKHLAAKLLALRQKLGMSQTTLARSLVPQISDKRVSEYESGRREPNLFVLLAYARLAGIPLEHIVDDDIDLTRFRDALIKEIAAIEKGK